VPREIVFSSTEIDRMGEAIRAVQLPVPIRRRIEFFTSQFELCDAAADQFEYKTKDTAHLSGVEWTAVTAQDTRWARCDIKSVSLLANVLLRQLAVDDGASECILLRDGQLTDSSASSVHAVIGGEVRTPPNSWKLLPGTTRGVLEEIAERAGVKRLSVAVSEAELRAADEILLGAATREIQPVTSLDGRPVGNGKPGPVWRKLYDAYQAYKKETAGTPW
jgi:branched-subunit amino acid aminotransferase/4-amino-4-deoxychorismate lyase